MRTDTPINLSNQSTAHKKIFPTVQIVPISFSASGRANIPVDGSFFSIYSNASNLSLSIVGYERLDDGSERERIRMSSFPTTAEWRDDKQKIIISRWEITNNTASPGTVEFLIGVGNFDFPINISSIINGINVNQYQAAGIQTGTDTLAAANTFSITLPAHTTDRRCTNISINSEDLAIYITFYRVQISASAGTSFKFTETLLNPTQFLQSYPNCGEFIIPAGTDILISGNLQSAGSGDVVATLHYVSYVI